MEKRTEKLSLETKVKIADNIIDEGFKHFSRPVVVYSGGKDSTLVLYLVKEYCDKNGFKIPPCLFIDHGMHFNETFDFLEKIKKTLQLNIIVTSNDDAISKAKNGKIETSKLNAENKYELQRVGYSADTLPYSLHTEAGNHILKTVPMNDAIKKNRFDVLMVGVRWDENEARSGETFLSHRDNPFHYRLHPILLFTEKDVWDYTLKNDLPKHPLYSKGFRSIDGKEDSIPTSDLPAWKQDFNTTLERAGRSQDKEGIMERLRKLGYM